METHTATEAYQQNRTHGGHGLSGTEGAFTSHTALALPVRAPAITTAAPGTREISDAKRGQPRTNETCLAAPPHARQQRTHAAILTISCLAQ